MVFLKFDGGYRSGFVVVVAYALVDVAIDASVFWDAVLYAVVHSSHDAMIESVFDGYVDLSIDGVFGDCGDVFINFCDGLWDGCGEDVGYQVILHLIEAC